MFTRSLKNPILRPDKNSFWQSRQVYNPAVIYDKGGYHLFYRATGRSGKSAIGYARSREGINFTRIKKPAISPVKNYESRNVEDPRLAKINNIYFLTYTAYDGHTARLALATSKNLKTWQKHGPILPDYDLKTANGFIVPWDLARNQPQTKNNWTKAGAIFPDLINNQYQMLFGDSNIWFATSKNGKKWDYKKRPFLTPRCGNFFDNEHIEMGPPAIKTNRGWLALYHGIDSNIVYRLGYLLLDLKDPEKILFRSKKPIFEPSAQYEIESPIDVTRDDRPKVIFCCGAVVVDDILRIYYGAADKYICTASVPLDKLLDNII